MGSAPAIDVVGRGMNLRVRLVDVAPRYGPFPSLAARVSASTTRATYGAVSHISVHLGYRPIVFGKRL